MQQGGEMNKSERFFPTPTTSAVLCFKAYRPYTCTAKFSSKVLPGGAMASTQLYIVATILNLVSTELFNVTSHFLSTSHLTSGYNLLRTFL